VLISVRCGGWGNLLMWGGKSLPKFSAGTEMVVICWLVKRVESQLGHQAILAAGAASRTRYEFFGWRRDV
jgi:hypothetical protein